MLKLSIFRKACALPKTREEKEFNMPFTSKPYLPEVLDIENDDDLIKAVTSFSWSPFVFSGYRRQDNFISTDFMVLDIDSNLTIEQAEKRVIDLGYTCLCVPTTNHSNESHRFRLVFPLSSTIYNSEAYKLTATKLFELFPEADKSCVTDTARCYFGSTLNDGFWLEGGMIKPVKPKRSEKDNRVDLLKRKVIVAEDIKTTINEIFGDVEEIPECVDYFIRNAHTGMEGEWTVSLNAFVFTLALLSIDFETTYGIVEKLAPNQLDGRDLKTIEKAYKDGENIDNE